MPLSVEWSAPHAAFKTRRLAHPAGGRSTGISVAYNVAVMVFGGFAPLIVTWLTRVLGTPVAPAFYVVFACVLALLGTYCMHEAPRAKKPLPFSSEVKP